MNNMVAIEEFGKQNALKNQGAINYGSKWLKQKMHKTMSKQNDLVERSKDLDLAYVKNRLKE
jgi:hypothetical protein